MNFFVILFTSLVLSFLFSILLFILFFILFLVFRCFFNLYLRFEHDITPDEFSDYIVFYKKLQNSIETHEVDLQNCVTNKRVKVRKCNHV